MIKTRRWYLGQCARSLDASLRRWIEENEHFSYISMQWAAAPKEMARDGYHPGAGQYRYWAQLVAERAAGLLEAEVQGYNI